MMKKILTGLLIVCVVLGLAACGLDSSNAESETTNSFQYITSSKSETPNAENNDSSVASTPHKEDETESSKPTENEKSDESSTDKTSSKKPSVTVPDKEETKGNLVWIPVNGGKKYHKKASCSNMKDPMQVTKETAIENGYGPCGKCY